MDQIKELFDYRLFAGNSKLDAMCKSAKQRYGGAKPLSDEDLATVAAAGEPFETKDKTDDDKSGNNG